MNGRAWPGPHGRARARGAATAASRAWVLALATMTVLSAVGPTLCAGAAPNPLDPLELVLVPNVAMVEVTNDENGVVVFDGVATVDHSRLMNAQVTLSSSCVWPAVVSPSVMEFMGPGRQEFTVTVVVPPKTSSLMTGEVLVSGTYKAPGMPVETAEASAIVLVAHYHKSSLSVSDRSIRVARGAIGAIEITIHNEGNGPARYELQADAPEGFGVVFSPPELEIGADDQATVWMNVSAGDGAKSGEHQVVLRVEEVGVSQRTLDEMAITVRVGSPAWTWVAIVLLLVAAGVAVALWKGRLPALRRALSRKRDDGGAG